MKDHLILVAALVFLGMIFALTDPIELLMPTSVQMTALVLAILSYGGFAGLLYKQKPSDEREVALRNESSHSAFMVGTALLLAGITYQTLQHQLDHWLVWTMGLMVVTKVFCLYKDVIKHS